MVHLGMLGGHSISLRQMRAVLVKSPGQSATQETIIVSSVPQQTWFEPAGQSSLPAQFPDTPLHIPPTATQRNGCDTLSASKQQNVVTPGWHTSASRTGGAHPTTSPWKRPWAFR